MGFSRRALLRASAVSAGAIVLARPLGVLAQPLGSTDGDGVSRISRLFAGPRLVHADLHNHSIYSDGDIGAFPDLAYRTMYENGMDVAALTDHSSVSWAPAGVPSEFPCPPDDAPTVGEGCRSVMGLSNEEWVECAELARQFTVTREMAEADPSLREHLGLRGFEWSSPTLGHMNVWFTAEYIDPLHTGGISAAATAADFFHEGSAGDPTGLAPLLEEVLRAGADVQGPVGMAGFQAWLAQPPTTPVIGGGNDGLAGFNHPGREAGRFGDFAYEPALADTVVSLELLNRREDYLFELTDLDRRSPLVECLAGGWRPGILGVSDQHDPIKRGEGDLGNGRAGVWVDELTDLGVRQAMRERRFYSTRLSGLRLDAAANGVRMGQAFAHGGGPILIQVDLDAGASRAGRMLNLHLIGPPENGGLLPAILHEHTITLPADIIEFSVDVDPDLYPWIAVRISEPGPDSGSGLGFGPDGRAAGTPYEPLGAAWAYASPWYLDPAAAPPPPEGRAPLTVPPPDPGGSSDGGSSGDGGGTTPGTPGKPPTTGEDDPGPGEEPGTDADPGPVGPVVRRRAGDGRVETAVELSRAAFVAGAVDTVVVVNGGSFPDALGGGPAAATLPGPLLLVGRDVVPDATAAEIGRLRPRRVVVLGGEEVVAGAVLAAFGALVDVVERVAGPTRYDTAAAIARTFFPAGVAEAWVASGETFADALPAGAAAAAAGAPLLLVARDAVPDVVADELGRLAPERIVVVGGTSAVAAAVSDALASIAPVERLEGDDRFATAAAISRRGFASATRVIVCSGRDFPDALAAVPVAAMGQAPILTVEPDAIPASIDAELRRLKPEIVVVAGGPLAVAESVESLLAAYDIGR